MAYKVKLTRTQREGLIELVRHGKQQAKVILHANVLLQADCSPDGPALKAKVIAENLSINVRTVHRIRRKYAEEGIEAAIQRKPHKRYKPRKLDGEAEAHLIALCCSKAPNGRVAWTLGLLADELVRLNIVDKISKSAIRGTLKKNELKPWLTKEWCIPPEQSAEFVYKMEDILEVYKRPYDADYPLICMDESNKQHEQEKIKGTSAKPGKLERFDTSYEKNGVSNIFLSFEPLTGKRWVNVAERRTRVDWARHIQELVEVPYPDAKKIMLVVDNLNIHTGAALYELLEPAHARKIIEKIEFHYTPKHGSWLNRAEIELSHLFRQCLNRRLADINEVKKEVAYWMDDRNKHAYVTHWQFTTEDARIKLKRLYPTIKSDTIKKSE